MTRITTEKVSANRPCLWIREDFFDRPEVKFLLRCEHGHEIVYLYQQLAANSLPYNGSLPLSVMRKNQELQDEVQLQGLQLLEKAKLIQRFPTYIYIPNQPFCFRGTEADNPNFRGEYIE